MAVSTGSGSKAPHPPGSLSERFESGGLGPGAVSTGRGDPGGVSYGLYQLASRTGALGAFLGAEGAPWAAQLGLAVPGSAAFSAAWQAVAARAPDAFGEAQRAYISRTHYRPVVEAVRARSGLDLDGRALAVREVGWSCAVQHGGAARIIASAVATVDGTTARTAPDYDRALIIAIYAARSDYVRAVAARLGAGERRTLLNVVNQRYPAECAAALAMLSAPAG